VIEKASWLGYRLLGVPLSSNISKEKIEQFKEIAKNFGIDLVSRVNLTPKNNKELLRNLRRLRRKFEIIAVKCTSKAVSRQAAKDRRVDIIYFPNEIKKRFFDEAEAELASNALAALEIEIMQIPVMSKIQRIRFVSKVRAEIKIAERYNVPVVLSSGASDPMLLRKPRELAALAILFDMSMEKALKAISEIPISIIKRNREKLSPNFVAPGVKVVKRGKDCPIV
jgi:ribonuclease P/MRP protein subunit RPP1